MREDGASRTAFRVAMRRAAHQILDGHPKVLDDPIAVPIIGGADEVDPDRGPVSKHFRAFMTVRSRSAEDQLGRAVERGTDQYVVLGAGLETFAYRNPFPNLRVFEVDHPATQAWKRKRLHAAAISIPENLTFVPVDFEKKSLDEELARAGFEMDRPSFFSWLAVVMYLTLEAATATLRFIASLPRGSGIVFDYGVARSSLNLLQRAALDALSRRVARAGEPFQLFFEPAELVSLLRGLGFTQMEDLGTEEINRRYFESRSDGLRVAGGVWRLMAAWV
ncbi:MAG: class I SAM-dependent methyltransferase [Bryobacteraceae bacterium]